MTYKIYKTPAKYNVTGKDTYSILYKAKTPIKWCTECWLRAVDELFYTLDEAEKALAEIKKPRDRIIYEV
jgi:hypothetical protein